MALQLNKHLSCSKLLVALTAILSVLLLLNGCAFKAPAFSSSSATNADMKTAALSSSTFFYIQHDPASNTQDKHTYQQKNWTLSTQVVEKQNKPKANLYNFTLTSSGSSAEKFTITDINYKYGSYGKWRIIEKRNYLSDSPEKRQSITIKRFPITIKKIDAPHNQLLQLTLQTEKKQEKTVNLIFGIQKCIAKTQKEFVCF